MRTLVAGCAGFIGFHLCERLLADGHEVVGVDNLVTGQRRNVDDLRAHAAFSFVEQDITRPLAIDGPLARIYDMACPASPVDFARRPLEILNVCSRGLWNLLDLACAKQARLLHASTSEVYGDPQQHPQGETYWGHVNPIGPRACYDEGKRFGEALIVNYAAQCSAECRIARIFNTYGPRMRTDDGRVLPNFIHQALRGAPLTVHGSGNQTRSFCYVTDLVDGLVRLMESDVREPVNLGNPSEISISDFAREIIRLTGSRSELTFVPRPKDDPELRRPDITRARQLLGWEPRVERAAGLQHCVEWFRAEMRPPRA